MTTPPKTTRWLDLLALLLARYSPITREEIFAKIEGYVPESGDLESARRKFERDKDELRQLGIDIQTVGFQQIEADDANAGYRLKARDFYLPYFELAERARPARPYQGLPSVSLSEDEARILDRATARLAAREGAPLAGSARSLRRKLAFDLPLGGAPVERVLARTLDAPANAILGQLQEAVAEHRVVRCRYYSIGRDAEEERIVEPWGLFFSWGAWYCVGKARDRDAVRVFRLERMQQAELLEETFAVPDGFTIRDYVGRRPWELGEGEPVRATVRFAFPESRWMLAQGTGEVVDDTLADGGAVIAFAVRDANPFLRWLLTFGSQAELMEPSALRDELADLRRRVADIYGRTAERQDGRRGT